MKNACYRFSITYFADVIRLPTVKNFCDLFCSKYIFQYEQCPTTHSTHFQCYVTFKEKYKSSALKSLLNNNGLSGADFSPAASIGLTRYCSKNESRIDGPWASGDHYFGKDLQVVRDNMFGWQKRLVRLVDEEPHDRHILWYYDPDGCAGKSKFCKYMTKFKDCLAITTGKASDILYVVKEMEKKRMYIFDLARTIPKGYEDEFYLTLESVKNGYFINTKYKGGVVMFETPHVIVFSNFMPNRAKLSDDRWRIITDF